MQGTRARSKKMHQSRNRIMIPLYNIDPGRHQAGRRGQTTAMEQDRSGSAVDESEMYLLRIFHDEKIGLQQMADSANLLRTLMSNASPEHSVPEGVSEAVDVLETGCRRLLRIGRSLADRTAALLCMSAMRKRRTELVSMLRGICLSFQPSALQLDIHLAFSSNSAYLHALVDPYMMARILRNLLSNALKHTPNDGHICVRLDRTGTGTFRLMVTDSGTGISSEAQEHLYDRFFTVPDDPRAGSGLGLNSVKEMVEMHGGSIRCQSTPGQGTRFTIDMPLDRKPPACNAHPVTLGDFEAL